MLDHSYSSTHPPLPPTTEDDQLTWLRLLRSRRVGPTTFWRLLSEHGDARSALSALPGVARAAGVQKYETCPEGVALAEMRNARLKGARMLCAGAPGYPEQLLDLKDAPPLLWVMGEVSALRQPMIALAGARNASSLGLRMSRALSRDLGQAGYCIVSGLARGIDAAAHTAALDTGTIGVLAGGVDVIYPSENTRLGEEILEKGGALISEQPIGMQPMARHFPTRNRIISGLAQAVVIVEAAAKSGSLITARGALDQGREVLAVPGHPFDARASGCNMLIRDGARLVRDAVDVMETLGPLAEPEAQLALPIDLPPPSDQANVQTGDLANVRNSDRPRDRRSLQETAALHSLILDRLGPSPVAEDQLIRDLHADPREVSPALTDLELTGRVARRPGGLLTLVQPG